MIQTDKIALRKRILQSVILTILLVSMSFSVISGQKTKDDLYPYNLKEEESPPFRERLFFGGSFGLMFGTITDIQVSPVIGVWLLPRIAVATGPTYRYYKDQISGTTIYGAKGYLKFVVVQDINSVIPVGVHTGIFLHLENELLSLKSSYWKFPPITSERFYVNTVLAGGGLSQQIGRRSSLDFMVLWPINDSGYGIYSKPEIRISFIF